MEILGVILYAIICQTHVCLAQDFDAQSIVSQAVAGATFNIDTSIQIPTIPAIPTGTAQSTTPTSTTESSSPTSSTSTSSSTSTTTSTSSSPSATSSSSTSPSSTTSTSKSSSTSTSKSSSTSTSTSKSSSSSASASASKSSSSPTSTANPPYAIPSTNHTKLGVGIGVPFGLIALALAVFLALRHKRHKQDSRLQHQDNLAASGLNPATDRNGLAGSQNDRNGADVENGSEPPGLARPDVHEICGTEIPPYSRELVGSTGVRRHEMPTRQNSVYIY